MKKFRKSSKVEDYNELRTIGYILGLAWSFILITLIVWYVADIDVKYPVHDGYGHEGMIHRSYKLPQWTKLKSISSSSVFIVKILYGSIIAFLTLSALMNVFAIIFIFTSGQLKATTRRRILRITLALMIMCFIFYCVWIYFYSSTGDYLESKEKSWLWDYYTRTPVRIV